MFQIVYKTLPFYEYLIVTYQLELNFMKMEFRDLAKKIMLVEGTKFGKIVKILICINKQLNSELAQLILIFHSNSFHSNSYY